MHIMYVDESGDPGSFDASKRGNSPHYILSGIVLNMNDWGLILQRLRNFRLELQKKYGLSAREEIHASELIRVGKIEAYKRIRKRDRLHILEDYARAIPHIFAGCMIINICLDKVRHPASTNFQHVAWNRLLNRYNYTLSKTLHSKGMIIADVINDPSVDGLMRKMRNSQPDGDALAQAPGRDRYHATSDCIIEDLFNRDSKRSYFIQSCDVVAQVLYRREFPKASLKKYNVDRFFNYLEPILYKKASNKDPLGIVRY